MTAPSGRTIATAIAGVVAVMLIVVGTVGVWAMRTATDAEWIGDRVESLLGRPEVSDAVADRVVDEIAAQLDLDAQIAELTPDALEPAADLLAATVGGAVRDRVSAAIRDDDLREIVGRLVTTAAGTAIDVIEGDELVDRVDVVGDEVRINLLPVVARALGELQDLGLFAEVEIPDMTADGDPTEQRSQLESAFGVDLADDFGTPTIYRSEAVESAGSTVTAVRDLVVLARRAVWLLVGLGIVLGVVALWSSARRPRTALLLVAGTVVGHLLVRLVVGTAGRRAADAVDTSAAEAALVDVVAALRGDLERTMLLAVLLTAVVAIGTLAVARRRPEAD